LNRALGALAAVTGLFCAPLIFGRGFVANAGDLYDYAAPFRAWASFQLQGGRLPLWNPHIFSGAPFLASPQSAVFYPLTALFAALPLGPAFRVFVVLHFILMASGFWLWLKARGHRSGGALAGAVVGSFGFFFLSKVAAGHVIHLSGYAWTPFVFLLGEGVVRCRPQDRLAPWALATASALQFYSGHLQVWLVTHWILVFLIADSLWKRPGAVRALGASALAAVGLITAQALPTAEYLSRTTRGLSELLSVSDRYAFATSYSMSAGGLLRGWLWPWTWGSPAWRPSRFPEPLSVFFETAAVHLGWLGLGLGLWGLILLARGRRWRSPVLAAGSLFLALGKNGPFYPLLWRGVSWLRVPARFYLGFQVAMSSGVAAAWDVGKGRRGLKTLLFLAVVGELWLAGHGFVRMENPGPRLERTTLVEWLQERGGRPILQTGTAPGGGRILTTQSAGRHNKSMMFGISNLNGYEALVPADSWRYLVETQPGVTQPTTGVDVERTDSPALAALGLRYVVSGGPLDTRWPIVWSAGDLRVYENPAPIPVFRAEGTIRRAFRESPEKFRVEWRSTSGASATLSPQVSGALRWTASAAVWAESWAPGWRAWTRGGEIKNESLRGVFQKIEVGGPPGDREAWWLYRPLSVRCGLGVTVLVLIGAALALGRGLSGRIRGDA